MPRRKEQLVGSPDVSYGLPGDRKGAKLPTGIDSDDYHNDNGDDNDYGDDDDDDNDDENDDEDEDDDDDPHKLPGD